MNNFNLLSSSLIERTLYNLYDPSLVITLFCDLWKITVITVIQVITVHITISITKRS